MSAFILSPIYPKNIFWILLIGAIFFAGGFWFFNAKSPSLPDNTQGASLLNGNIKQLVVKMYDTGFSPDEIEINRGDTVTFQNKGKNNHWPASNIHPTHQIYPQFDPLRPIAPGSNWSFKFDKAGIWKFHDHLYPEFVGTITAKENNNFINETTGKNLTKKKTAALKIAEKKQSSPPPPNILDKALETKLENINMFEVSKKKDELHYWLKTVGSKKVMAKLLKDSGGGSTLDCHQESHIIGKAAYEIYGASAFRDGNASCHSGFYHGAMEGFLSEKGTLNLDSDIKAVCDLFDTGFGRFECLHGVGHGVMAYEDYDLPKALETCGLLSTDYDRSSCYGGIFMENIVAGQGLGAIQGHGTKWVNKDPQFPCNLISQDYSIQFQCYQMQTSWMLTLFNYNFDLVSAECPKVRPDMVSVCYKSFGRDAAGHTLRNPQKIVDICGKVPRIKDYYDQCVIGALNVIVDFWGSSIGDKGSELCKLIPEEGKKACYSTLTSRLFDVFKTSEERKLICNTFENSYQNYCNAI